MIFNLQTSIDLIYHNLSKLLFFSSPRLRTIVQNRSSARRETEADTRSKYEDSYDVLEDNAPQLRHFRKRSKNFGRFRITVCHTTKIPS